MEFFCGLDVAMDETAVCVVDDRGAVHLQATALTDPDALLAVLKPFLRRLRRSATRPVRCRPGCIRNC